MNYVIAVNEKIYCILSAIYRQARREREEGVSIRWRVFAARVERLSAFKTSILIRLRLRSLSLPFLVLGD